MVNFILCSHEIFVHITAYRKGSRPIASKVAYGVPSSLTSEPKIIEIRNGSKVTLNSTSLKNFNKELNTSEVFAYAHGEIDELSGQLLLDVANRLPVLLKIRYWTT